MIFLYENAKNGYKITRVFGQSEVVEIPEAQKEVLDYMDENPDEAMEEAAEFLDLDVNAVKEMYEYYDFDMTIKDSDIEAMKSTMEFMLDTEMIEEEVDIEELVIR